MSAHRLSRTVIPHSLREAPAQAKACLRGSAFLLGHAPLAEGKRTAQLFCPIGLTAGDGDFALTGDQRGRPLDYAAVRRRASLPLRGLFFFLQPKSAHTKDAKLFYTSCRRQILFLQIGNNHFCQQFGTLGGEVSTVGIGTKNRTAGGIAQLLEFFTGQGI